MAAEGSNPQGPLCSDKAGFDYTHSLSLLCINLSYQMTKLFILQVSQLIELASLDTLYLDKQYDQFHTNWADIDHTHHYVMVCVIKTLKVVWTSLCYSL